MRRILALLATPLAVVMALFLGPARDWFFPEVVPPAAALARAADSAPAVLVLDANRLHSIASELSDHYRVYRVPRWRQADPARLAELIAGIDEDQLLLVGRTLGELAYEPLPPESPIVAGTVALRRSPHELYWTVDRLASRAQGAMMEERELFRLLRGQRFRT